MSDGTPQKSNQTGADTGQSASRLPSIPGSIKEEDEEDIETPDTIRQSESSIVRRDYGSIEAPDGTVRHRSTQQRPISPLNPLQLSPQVTRTQKRPPTSRRASVRRSVPHRGEQFSVDDDPFEVEGDRVEQLPPLKRTPSLVRRRTTTQPLTLAKIETREPIDNNQQTEAEHAEVFPDESEAVDDDEDNHGFDGEDDDTLSEAESFTLRDRQLAINETHPFGIRIWKPALYKKNRSVEKNAEDDIHSSPSPVVNRWIKIMNILWTVVFGWWMALFAVLAAFICFMFALESSAAEYARVFWGLAGYLFWPFGKFVKLQADDQYAEEDEGEGRSIGEYERWQNDLEHGRLMFAHTVGDIGTLIGRRRNSIESASERDHLLGRNRTMSNSENAHSTRMKRRLFGRGQWTLGRIVFFGFFYFLLAPLMLLVSLICWFMVFTIPMGRVLAILLHHMRKRPLALSFHPDISYARDGTRPSSILLCTYRAAGLKYWKYTVDGTNIFLINFLVVVVFVIVDYFVLGEALGLEFWLTSPALIFSLALISVIPLAYFIGQAVASISAQSSMGMGAAVNAFFSTVVEVYLYCIALNEGKAQLVEGSVIGSIFAGLLLLPGLSMCTGAIKRKTQRFNVKSAGATTTMLLFAIIATFGPTLFYKIYGSHELVCLSCIDTPSDRDCRRCYFRQNPMIHDKFFSEAIRPYCWAAAILLFLSYIIGLLFTLRTHAAVIWTTEIDEKQRMQMQTTDNSPFDTRLASVANSQQLANNVSQVTKSNIRESQLYTKILGQSLRSAGIQTDSRDEGSSQQEQERGPQAENDHKSLPHVVPPKTPVKASTARSIVPGLTEEENSSLVHQVAELAATAATIAARDVVQHPRTTSYQLSHSTKHEGQRQRGLTLTQTLTAGEGSLRTVPEATVPGAPSVIHEAAGGQDAPGGHDAPNWSRVKSSVILLTATVAYGIIAEILVQTVDVVLQSVEIDEKFLGITLFALVPNTTEFLNAISFAMNGNIALSMEIGSAYVLQVCLLQIPALVLFTALNGYDTLSHTFNLIFPQWDMVTVILCVFLLSQVLGEGKSNYFKGSILVMTYLVVVLGFWYSSFTSLDIMGVDPSDTLAIVVGNWAGSQGTQKAHHNLVKKSEL